LVIQLKSHAPTRPSTHPLNGYFEFTTFTLEPADTSLSESTRLHADPSTLRPGSLGPSTGDLWLTLGGAAFPGAQWNDFIVVILGAWCAAVLRVVRPRSRTEQVHFMEGPYVVELSRAGQGELHVRAMQRPGGEIAHAVVSISAHVTNLLEAQIVLAGLGISAGPIDGNGGAQSAAALRAYQMQHGLEQTGWLDRPTREALRLTARPWTTASMYW
jgi:hypothetical protein